MKVILDAERMQDREETFSYLREQFRFPEYFGNNLDALYDCLTELSDTVIVVEHEDQAGAWYQKIKRVLQNACEVNEELKIEN